jgi:orotidine-5'-phosphate decarboxylase
MAMSNTPGPHVIVALDYPDALPALDFAAAVTPAQCRLKVGKELFTRAGPALVQTLTGRGFSVFLDLKFHDIPNTVANACRAAADLGVWMVNVHCLGGRRMLEAARKAMDECPRRPLLVGVTILTSMDDTDLGEVGLSGSAADNVLRLASLAQASGLDGVVCSPREAASLRAACGRDFLLVTPGIRPVAATVGDQRRVMSPEEARQAGSDYLVIGRPVTQSDNPVAVLTTIQSSLDYSPGV